MQTNGLNIALIGCGFFGVQLASAFDKAQANLIAESLAKKFGLETKPHPKPYPLGWIHDK